MNSADPAGYVRLGPNGGDHRYSGVPLAGIDAAILPLAPAMPRGRLKAEADAFLHDARILADGRAIAINGGRIPIAPSDQAVAAAVSVVAMLEGATALSIIPAPSCFDLCSSRVLRWIGCALAVS